MRLNINTNELVKFTVKLEKLRKSALPNAVRGTLNDAAFDLKQKTMPEQSRAKFINRTPNFFKANSRAQKAVGWDVNSMKSQVGFVETNLKGQNNFAVRDLQQQEQSGSIDGKSFIPMDPARRGGYTTMVKPASRLTAIKNKIVVASKIGKGTKRQQFIQAIYKAGVGGFVLGSNVKGENTLWKVDKLGTNNDHNGIGLTPLYDYRKNRSVQVDETGFMRTASMTSAHKMDRFYIAQANFWINKYAR